MELTAPGMKMRRRAGGPPVYYWVASTISRKASDYPLKTVRLHGTREEMAAKCNLLTAELRQWLSKRGKEGHAEYDGTLVSLIRLYQHTPESPYHEVKANTRAMYDESLRLLEKTVGTRRLDKLTGIDFKRWYANFKEPAKDTTKQALARAEARAMGVILPPNPERQRRAYKAMQLLRILVKFGVVMNITECFRLATVLSTMEFSAPKSRDKALNFEQAKAICERAIKKGKLSIALAQALQFELTLRQIDVIGLWVKSEDARNGGITDRGQRWQDGLQWSHLSASGILTKVTSKTGKVAEHDTNAYPYLRKIIDLVPDDQRIGPMIVCESTGLPYRYRHFRDVWRELADEVGVPADVWNRDSRAGGVTEGSDAGADIEHLRHHANHENIQTTTRYDRKTLEKTRKVAKLRVAHREGKNKPKTAL